MNKNRWLPYFSEQGLCLEQATLLSKYAVTLEEQYLPVIFELEHLSNLLGIDFPYLKGVVRSSCIFYRSFHLNKRSGGERLINSPYPKLAYIQDWIKTNLLDKLDVSDNAYAYVKGRCNIDNARHHVGKVELLKLDLEDFFGHIKEDSVTLIFESLGYSNKLSKQLSKICCINGCLPQGACTSPVLSNLILREMDLDLSTISIENKFKYSRYADDIFFSADVISKEVINEIRNIIKSYGFVVNEKKVRHIVGNKRKVITGLCVDNSRVRVTKRDRREFRKIAYYLLKNGISQFNGDKGELSPLYIDQVIGKAQYILNVETDNDYVKVTLEKLLELRKRFLLLTE
jgi:RNA-directed DNA polymerase